MLKIKSNDGVDFEVSEEVVKMSDFLDTCFNMCNNKNDDVVVVPTVNGKILSKVVEFCNYYCENPYDFLNIEKPINDDIINKIPKWYLDFTNNISLCDEIYEMIEAANFLSIEQFLDLCTLHIARSIKNKTPEEVKKMFNVNVEEQN